MPILSYINNNDDIYVLVAALAAFVVVWLLGNSFHDNQDRKLQARLKLIHKRRQDLKQEYLSPEKRKKITESPPDWMRFMVEKLAILKDNQISKLNMKLIQAGYRSKGAVIFYAFAKIVMPIMGLAIGLLLAKINWEEPFNTKEIWRFAVVIICGYIGATIQDIWLHNQRQKRYHAIRLALPDSLDLMLICAEAGLSLAATLDRVAKELGQAYPEMAEELTLTSIEIGFLPERSTALRHLMERVDIQEVRGIVNVLLQTEKYGTPIGQALRVLSKEFRTERMLRAEQKAAQLPALMTIPLIVFILPTLFIIVLAPAIINIMDTM